jgi:hypothetical protein
MVKNQEEVRILLESLSAERIRIKTIRKKILKGNQVKYTFIVEDTAIPEISPIKTRKNSNKKVIKEQPKEKVVIQTKKDKVPIPPARPDMAEIVHI